MKKILQFSTLLMLPFLYAQQISDYQYIRVPEKFGDAEVNKSGLNELLQIKLKQKKFTVLTTKDKWPADAMQNPCHIMTAELLNNSNMFKNRLKIEFKDCENKTISVLDGKSSIKEFEPGMRDALEDAVKQIPPSSPVEQFLTVKPKETKKAVEQTENQNTTRTVVTETQTVPNNAAPKTEKTVGQKAEVYANGNITVTRIFLAEGEFILVNPNHSVPYATFKPTAKKEVYRVKLADGTATFGYLEEEKIVIELPNSDGSYRNEVYSRK